MAADKYELAQFNIGTLKYPRCAPQMAGYHESLTQLTPVALAWPGFICIMDDSIIELTIAHYGSDVAANLSVWSSLESLKEFMSCPVHAAVMQRGNEWFVPMEEASYVFWWIPAGTRPTFTDACLRLAGLRDYGPSAQAFTLARMFPCPV